MRINRVATLQMWEVHKDSTSAISHPCGYHLPTVGATLHIAIILLGVLYECCSMVMKKLVIMNWLGMKHQP